jgi:hypothetical protein
MIDGSKEHLGAQIEVPLIRVPVLLLEVFQGYCLAKCDWDALIETAPLLEGPYVRNVILSIGSYA